MKQKFFIFACFAVIFATVFGSSVYAMSLSDFPEIPKASNENSVTFIYKTSAEEIKAYVIYEKEGLEFTVEVQQNGGSQILLKKLPTDLTIWQQRYVLGDSGWVPDSLGIADNVGAIEQNFSQWLYSDVDVVSSQTGEVVFKAPPATPTLEEVILEGVTTLQTETLTTMETLTLCGVGLMALLVALVILPKVLYKFL